VVTDPQTNKPTNKHTHKDTHKQTGPITIHCAAKLSAQCNDPLLCTMEEANSENRLIP